MFGVSTVLLLDQLVNNERKCDVHFGDFSVNQNEGFRINEGVKELINGTTTATELPINGEVIEEVSHAPENSRPQGFSSSSSFKTTVDELVLPDASVGVGHRKCIIEPHVSRCGPGERLTHSGKCRLIYKNLTNTGSAERRREFLEVGTFQRSRVFKVSQRLAHLRSGVFITPLPEAPIIFELTVIGSSPRHSQYLNLSETYEGYFKKSCRSIWEHNQKGELRRQMYQE
ncbi:hypothetical protein J6590_086366 [Homalodisca vitripennis]|nr:hypothetical protein J6590_086366 [Homalodisca vitripennis]